jgi:enoyl-CoA hydratase/carnithine racemase
LGYSFPVRDYECIRFEMAAEHVARVVLSRPEAANALSLDMFGELADAIERIDRDDEVRVWILTGAPRIDGRPWFSAGADLKMTAPGAGRAVNPAQVVDRIDDLLKPSIAAIAGVCTTGALELAMACDIRVAAESAMLSDWHLKATGLGIGAWGSAVRLSRLVGVDKAKELLLTGVEVSGIDAARIGLVNRVVPDGRLDAEVFEQAATIAAMPAKGVRTTLGFLAVQEDRPKWDALRWAQLTPEWMGVQLRPFQDAAGRFERRQRPGREGPSS